MPREYSQAGMDYTKVELFKQAMQAIGKRTLNFPNRRRVHIDKEAGNAFERHGWSYPASRTSAKRPCSEGEKTAPALQ